MKEVRLSLPLSEEQVRELELGDVLYLTGTVYQFTSAPHKRVLEMLKKGEALPFDLKGMAIYHAYTSMARKEGGWRFNYLGATTSAMVNPFEPEFIRKTGIRAVLGKGGMDQGTLDAMREAGCVYLAQVGGCSAVYSEGVKEISAAYWEDLGPNLVVALEMEQFGPLTVAMDARGNSSYMNTEKVLAANLEVIHRELGAGV